VAIKTDNMMTGVNRDSSTYHTYTQCWMVNSTKYAARM